MPRRRTTGSATPEAVIARWSEAEVVLTADVRLIDLRDPARADLGLDRSS